jgi:hypothetical protein
MKTCIRAILPVLLITAAGCEHASMGAAEATKHAQAEALVRSAQEHLDKTEEAIAMIVQNMSNGEAETAGPAEVAQHDDRRLSPEEAEAELFSQRQQAIERSLSNIATAVANSKKGVGSNCHWKEVCTYWYCKKWGSTGNGGTAKCLEYECGATEWRLVCD